LTLWLSGREQLVPRDLVFPPDKSRDDVEKAQNADFKHSEFSAEYAALGFLKYPEALTVEKVTDPGPSAGKQVRDAIDAVDGTRSPMSRRSPRCLKTRPGQIAIDFRRKNAPPGTARITLGDNADRDYGYLGSRCSTPVGAVHHRLQPGEHRRPAGLMFSLAVIDKLTTGDLNGAKFVAGTGTISEDGKVGPIGGITHKMMAAQEAGATVFLVPAENCDEARTAKNDAMELVKVATLDQAVDSLHTSLPAGVRPAARCVELWSGARAAFAAREESGA
jgi:PDZ domain-containing protein